MHKCSSIALFSRQGRDGIGLLLDDGIFDLTARERSITLDQLVLSGEIASACARHADASPDFGFDAVTLRPPLPRGGKIMCVGVNYPDRTREYAGRMSADVPDYPSLFVRFPTSFVGCGQPLVRPTVSRQFDYEGEIAIVIGKGGRHIPEADALQHISALTLCNEGSVRDWMRHGRFNVTQGKNFDRSGSMGPGLVAYVDEAQIADIGLQTRVNGALRQDDRTSRMLFSFRRIIGYVSTFMTLAPGDIILTGTPTGAGAHQDPPRWLEPGDLVEISADGLGTLRNMVADETVG